MKYFLISCALIFSLAVQAGKVDSKLYKNLKKAKKSKSEKAMVKAVSEILAVDGNDFLALNTLAVFYYEARKYSMSKLLLDRAIKVNPDKAELKNNLALVHFALDNKKLGLQTLKKAAASSKSDSEANLNLSSIYVDHRDYKKALGPLSNFYPKVKSKLKSKSKAAVALANNYAISLVGSGNKSKAETVFKQAMDAGVRDTNLLFNYASYMVDQNKDKDAAYKIISRLKFLSDDRKLLRKVELLEKKLDNKK